VVDVSDPADPTETGSFEASDSAWDVSVSGSYAYLAADGAGVRTIDVADPANPDEVGYFDTPDPAYGVTNADAYTYVAAEEGGVYITRNQADEDVTPPAVPTGLSADASDREVTLTWEPNTESDLAEYRLYRFVLPQEDTEYVDDIPAGTETYTDTDLTNGREHSYWVTAVDDAGNESDFSEEVQEMPEDNNSPVAFVWPVNNWNLSENGYAALNVIDNGEYHTGLDITSNSGDLTVKAAAPGVVRTIPNGTLTSTPDCPNNNHCMGNIVIIDHENGLFTLYAHLDEIVASNGQNVTAGQQIGVMGNTGVENRGIHLHFESKMWGVAGSLTDDAGPQWGYTPEHPNLHGYLNPRPYLEYPIEHVASTRVQVSGDQIVRTGPDSEDYTTTVTSVEDGQRFASFAEQSGWYQIYLATDHGPATGWIQAASVAGNLMRIDDPARGKVGVNVRTDPATSSDEISHVWDTQEFVYDDLSSAGSGCSASWYKVPLADNAPGNFGWVCGEYVSGEDPPDLPAAPTGLTASEDEGQVTLTWEPNNEDDLAEYRLYRNTSPEPTTRVATIPKGTTNHPDPDVSNGTTYYYRLTAVDTDGNESGYSNEVPATPSGSGDGEACPAEPGADPSPGKSPTASTCSLENTRYQASSFARSCSRKTGIGTTR